MRFRTIVNAALLIALPACESSDTSDKVTGVCLYAAKEPLVAACMNQWAADTSCSTVGAQTGTYQAGEPCDARGYAQPCTYDHPQSLWVADDAEDAACDAWNAE